MPGEVELLEARFAEHRLIDAPVGHAKEGTMGQRCGIVVSLDRGEEHAETGLLLESTPDDERKPAAGLEHA